MARIRAGSRRPGAGWRRGDRHRADEPELPRRCCRPGGERASVVVKLAADGPDEPRDRRRPRRLRARDPLLPRARAAIDRRALARCHSPSTTRPRAGSRSCSRTSRPRRAGRPDRRLHGRRRRGSRCARWRALHAPVLGDPRSARPTWLNQPNAARPGAAERSCCPASSSATATAIAPEHREVCRALRREPRRLGGRPPRAARRSSTATTGSTTCCSATPTREAAASSTGRRVSWGPAMLDASYFLGGGLTVEDRRAHEERAAARLLRRAARARRRGLRLGAVLGGVPAPDASTASLMAIAPSMLVERTERGDEMFMTVPRAPRAAGDRPRRGRAAARAGAAARPRRCARSPPTRAATSPAPRQLWNESWYFDAVSEDGELGVYVRIGRLPEPRASPGTRASSAARAGRRSMLVDCEAPLPPADDELSCRTETTMRRATLRAAARSASA